MNSLRSFAILFVSLCLARSLVLGQSSCPAIVEEALDAVDAYCQNAGRNQACYGNFQLQAQPQAGATDFAFEQVGDIVDVADIETLTLNPLDEEAGVWGVALMRLQGNIPDTLPGQNVTVLLFGDVELINAVPDDDTTYTPMQAFIMSTGVGDSACDEMPESGVLIQTPEGVGEVTFNVNGVDVAMGSTILFQAEPGEEMRVSAVEGTATMQIDGSLHSAVPGTRLRVPIGRDMRPSGPPPPPEAYEQQPMQRLPVHLMGRPIEIHPPLSPDEVEELHGRLEAGEPACGQAPFPPCENLPREFVDRWCVVPPAEGESPLSSDDKRPVCPNFIQNTFEDRPCVFKPGPHDPPLREGESRPFCEETEGTNESPRDDRPCVFRPRAGDPPLPANETRPFCEDNPPPSSDGEQPTPEGQPRGERLPRGPSGGNPPSGSGN